MTLKEIAKRALLTSARRIPLIERAAQLIVSDRPPREYSYEYLKERFLENGDHTDINRQVRGAIVERFERIDREVVSGTTPTDGLFLAEALLNVVGEGDVVECGCYKGASSAKLSIVSSILGKRLFVFDSFQGLPENDEEDLSLRRIPRPSGRRDWKQENMWPAGEYAGRREEVQANIERFGNIEVCRFIEGWYQLTLTEQNLPSTIAMAFTDVDLASSARECLVALWPRLSDGGVYFSHDFGFVAVLATLHDPGLWEKELGVEKPIFLGAGFGICDASPHLGFFVKGSYTRDYLKRLTVPKWDKRETERRLQRAQERRQRSAEVP